jgi:hypothetical protein
MATQAGTPLHKGYCSLHAARRKASAPATVKPGRGVKRRHRIHNRSGEFGGAPHGIIKVITTVTTVEGLGDARFSNVPTICPPRRIITLFVKE